MWSVVGLSSRSLGRSSMMFIFSAGAHSVEHSSSLL